MIFRKHFKAISQRDLPHSHNYPKNISGLVSSSLIPDLLVPSTSPFQLSSQSNKNKKKQKGIVEWETDTGQYWTRLFNGSLKWSILNPRYNDKEPFNSYVQHGITYSFGNKLLINTPSTIHSESHLFFRLVKNTPWAHLPSSPPIERQDSAQA